MDDMIDNEAQAAEAAPEKRTPAEWAAKLGHIHQRDPRLPQSETRPTWQHAVADQLHGWTLHEHHFQGQPLLLSQADYMAALEAGGEYPVTPAHGPALSPALRKEIV